MYCEYADGTKVWRVNGVLHRTDGPAVDCPDGHKEWCINGVLHRTDGPAVEYTDGIKEFWINGNQLTPFEVWSLFGVKL